MLSSNNLLLTVPKTSPFASNGFRIKLHHSRMEKTGLAFKYEDQDT